MPLFDTQQANILMSNDTPPRACLADFGSMIMVNDPVNPMSCSMQSEGGTMTFMSPELLAPSMFDMSDPLPTAASDVYAFGLLVFQVCGQYRDADFLLTLSRSLQVKLHSVKLLGKRSWDSP